MNSIEIPKAYNPKDFEDRIYDFWLKNGFFKPSDKKSVKPFVMVMPPPNVTGILHIGHALNNTLPDILIRYYRMKGVPTLWVPGTDHAGIATQSVVEKQLAAQNISRKELGREKFIEKTWEVKDKHHSIITRQLKKMGCSCDWDRERFTLDEGLSDAVRKTFVSLYEKGLIYKGKYLVNYCPKCQTALSDEEVEYQEDNGHLWEVNYPFEDNSGYITVATTRPETMFGDMAVAVNPDDIRYKSLVGKMVCLPLTDRKIPIIADDFVGMEFGTGMVKITPAHDPNDWECGKRHNLTPVNILNPDGTLNDVCPEKFRGLKAEEARFAVAEELKQQGYLKNVTDYSHDVGHCYRCHTTVEPYMSDQWFVKMKPLAEKALKAWRDGEIHFYPSKWENTYSSWLENIRDWCISRQLWWGHRIPVWYCKKCNNIIVSETDPANCNKCGSVDIVRDPDVLDTWFSSWLWPFSTLGWPENTEDLKRFFPTTALITGYDIIFFWVSRMIMASLEFTGKVPFRDIYMTGLVRDRLGRKMSKSLGNGVDPLDVIDIYGADALKFTICFMSSQGQDVLVDMDSFKLGSRFANKIWNAVRFILMNLNGNEIHKVSKKELTMLDKWIYHSLNQTVLKTSQALESYRYNDAGQAVYSFFWNDFCDWYLEASKISLNSAEQKERDRSISIISDILEKSLRLLHPFMSFLTEELYSKLPFTKTALIVSPYPEFDEKYNYPVESEQIKGVQEIIRVVRNMRSEIGIESSAKISFYIRVTDEKLFSAAKENMKMILNLTNSSKIEFTDCQSVPKTIPCSGNGFECFLNVSEVIDVNKENERLDSELEKTEKLLKQVQQKLQNEQFMANAKKEAIDKEYSKRDEFSEKIQKIKRHKDILRNLNYV